MISTKLQGRWRGVELRRKDAVPGVAAGPGRARQREEIGSARHPGAGPALHRRGADFLVGEQGEQHPERGDRLLVDRRVRLDRHVPPGQPGAAGGDHHVHPGIRHPAPEPRLDLRRLVPHDRPVGQHMPRCLQPLDQQVARMVLGRAARVRDRQHRDPDRQESGPLMPAPQSRVEPGPQHQQVRPDLALLRRRAAPPRDGSSPPPAPPAIRATCRGAA